MTKITNALNALMAVRYDPTIPEDIKTIATEAQDGIVEAVRAADMPIRFDLATDKFVGYTPDIVDPDDYCRLCKGAGELQGGYGEGSSTCWQCGGSGGRTVRVGTI